MSLTVEEIRRQLETAMDVQDDPAWLERAERLLYSWTNSLRKRRIYDVSTIGARIRTAREVLGLTQPQLARRCGFHDWTISNAETGTKRVSLERLRRIAAVCGVKLEWLLCESDEGGPPLPTRCLRKTPRTRWPVTMAEHHKLVLKAELERLRGLRGPKEWANPPSDTADTTDTEDTQGTPNTTNT